MAATWIFCGDQSRRRRGRDADILWRRVAATPRPRRGDSVETSRGDAAAATWIFHGDGPRHRRATSRSDAAATCLVRPAFSQNFDRSTPAPRCAQNTCILKHWLIHRFELLSPRHLVVERRVLGAQRARVDRQTCGGDAGAEQSHDSPGTPAPWFRLVVGCRRVCRGPIRVAPLHFSRAGFSSRSACGRIANRTAAPQDCVSATAVT